MHLFPNIIWKIPFGNFLDTSIAFKEIDFSDRIILILLKDTGVKCESQVALDDSIVSLVLNFIIKYQRSKKKLHLYRA